MLLIAMHRINYAKKYLLIIAQVHRCTNTYLIDFIAFVPVCNVALILKKVYLRKFYKYGGGKDFDNEYDHTGAIAWARRHLYVAF